MIRVDLRHARRWHRRREPLRLRGGQMNPYPGMISCRARSTSAGMVIAFHSAWIGASGPGQYIALPYPRSSSTAPRSVLAVTPPLTSRSSYWK